MNERSAKMEDWSRRIDLAENCVASTLSAITVVARLMERWYAAIQIADALGIERSELYVDRYEREVESVFEDISNLALMLSAVADGDLERAVILMEERTRKKREQVGREA